MQKQPGGTEKKKLTRRKNHVMQLDAVHWQILEELQRDGRASFKEIAQKTGFSAPAIIERIRKMEENGVIKGYRAIIDPAAAGYSLHVIFFLKSRHNRYEDYLMAELDKMPEIVKYWSVTGETDIIIEAVVHDMNSLSGIIETLTMHGQVTTHFILFSSDETEKVITANLDEK